MYSGNVGRRITPLVLKNTSPTDFEIVGIGATRVSDGSGTQTFEFNLQSGSADKRFATTDPAEPEPTMM